MRSMDSSRDPDSPPGGGGGGGGRRHTQTHAASYDDFEYKPRQRGYRRQQDASTDEIIRFVRGYQLERESTWLRLQKRAPLPGIGQANLSVCEEPGFAASHQEEDHNFHMEGEEDDEDEDLLLDNEVSSIEAGHRNPLRHQFGVVDDFRLAPSFRAGPRARRYEAHFTPHASYGPPASRHRRLVRPLDGQGDVATYLSPKSQARKAWGRSLRQLPPIPREDVPDRPSAPSPSLTPPGEEEELDSAGEPVDFIDAP